MLILVNRCLLNVDFSIVNALNGQSSRKQNFSSPHLSMLFGKFCISFKRSLFYFKLYKISTDPNTVGISWLER